MIRSRRNPSKEVPVVIEHMCNTNFFIAPLEIAFIALVRRNRYVIKKYTIIIIVSVMT